MHVCEEARQHVLSAHGRQEACHAQRAHQDTCHDSQQGSQRHNVPAYVSASDVGATSAQEDDICTGKLCYQSAWADVAMAVWLISSRISECMQLVFHDLEDEG